MSDRTELVLNQDRVSELWNETKKYINENAQSVLTGSSGQLIGIGDDGTAQATVYPCNPNLLDGWYFVGGGSQNGLGQFPINRNGEVEYTTDGYTIDGWKTTNFNLKINAGFITLTSKQGYAWDVFSHAKEINLQGETVTLSFLYRTSSNSFRIVMGHKGGHDIVVMKMPPCSDFQVCSATVKITENENLLLSKIDDSGSVDVNSIDLIAAKLELGTVQTLAHEEGDRLVLNEIPNYAEQYAICSQYSPITGEFVGSQHSNLDLLDNALFIGGGSQNGWGQFPINQMGQTEYKNSGYFIDRFKFSSIGSSIIVKDNGLCFDTTGNISGIPVIQQFINQPSNLSGNTLTASILISEVQTSGGSAGFLEFVLNNVETGAAIFDNGKGLYTTTYTMPENLTSLEIRIGIYPNNAQSYTIIAAKLEPGSVQTLAHKEGDKWVLNDPRPDYDLELAKCKRYYRRYGPGITCFIQDIHIIITLPFENEMNGNPTIKLLNDTVNLQSGTDSYTLTNATINAQYVNNNGIIYLMLGGNWNTTPESGRVCRYNSSDMLFEVNANL